VVGGFSVPRSLHGSFGVSGSLVFFLSHLFTYMLLHPLHGAGESLCVAFEACIHASEGAQAPHDHVGLIAFYLKKNDFGGILVNA
jgi:hypothetical protein